MSIRVRQRTRTYVGSKDFAVFSVIGYHDPAAKQISVWPTTSAQYIRLSSFGEDLFPQLTCATALDRVQVGIHSKKKHKRSPSPKAPYVLIRTVDGDVDFGVLGNVAEGKAGLDNQFLRLEAWRERLQH